MGIQVLGALHSPPSVGGAGYPEKMSLPPLVEPLTQLPATEKVRAARHLSLAGLGELGQRRIAAAHVAIVGAGGLGSPTILALAAAGIGTLTVIDDDTVEVSNLQRQIIHRHTDVGAHKTISAERIAADLSPETRLIAVNERLTSANAEHLLSDADLVIDGSDTFDTREAVAAACETLGVPLVWGAVQEFDGQVTVFWSTPPAGHQAVLLHDLYPKGQDAPSCAAVGVFGPLCMQVGALLAAEAVKLVTGIGDPLLGRLLVIDSRRARQTEIPLRGGHHESSPRARRDVAGATLTSEREPRPRPPEIAVSELDSAVRDGATLLDVRERWETAAGNIPGSVLVPLADVLENPNTVGDGPFLVICQAGGRARKAATALASAGLAATVLTGGYDAWRRETDA